MEVTKRNLPKGGTSSQINSQNVAEPNFSHSSLNGNGSPQKPISSGSSIFNPKGIFFYFLFLYLI